MYTEHVRKSINMRSAVQLDFLFSTLNEMMGLTIPHDSLGLQQWGLWDCVAASDKNRRSALVEVLLEKTAKTLFYPDTASAYLPTSTSPKDHNGLKGHL